ncbi:glycosyl hydrolase 53 family protein [Pectobacterium cacticida]|uniref:Arabinogalactan endo-beta-1,4-galactanase n=1 Tax=Pectobacterium cacticida TaxID=69221 RepID=A0ABZ2GAE4_9GAMM|nr:glycosyl hydrolase 53 family protein [Pectobacterium cacticida]UYX07422.1 glycosyl hydrolase 53 family protein [Pectobacterium cacticida]
MKRNHYSRISILLLVFFMGIMSVNLAKAAPPFAYGADIGWVKQLEDRGVRWLDDAGSQRDVLQILRDHGINAVRLRVFVNPAANALWNSYKTTWTMLGYSDKNRVVEAALRAKAMGMRVMVDFHYSDVFADPARQQKPAAWANYNLRQLTSAVYNHTHEVMTTLVSAGVTPEWVQVGNEMNSGILLPEGSINRFADLTQLLNSGYDAVKAVSPSTKVISHLAHGNNNSNARWFFDNFLTKHGGKTDVIGFSFYPHWEGKNYWEITGDLANNLNDMARRYGKEVMVVEIGGLESKPEDSYWTVKNTIDLVKAVPGNKGIGVFYWEPAANANVLTDGYALGATKLVSANTLQFTRTVDAFAESQIHFIDGAQYKIVNRHSGKSLNIASGSLEDGATLEQYGDNNWSSQRFYFSPIGNGYFNIVNVNSGKYIDIDSSASENGAKIIQMYNTGHFSQQWLILDAGDGYYKILNRNSGKLLEIKSRSVEDGASGVQQTDNGKANQLWKITTN